MCVACRRHCGHVCSLSLALALALSLSLSLSLTLSVAAGNEPSVPLRPNTQCREAQCAAHHQRGTHILCTPTEGNTDLYRGTSLIRNRPPPRTTIGP
ncbi:hypothetical protein T484DRAFT_2438854 [Baffinella frigidus]|nr:hypothetical protein T484DRAFT_2438854 [Cryptophyta sp. CCMP2293]